MATTARAFPSGAKMLIYYAHPRGTYDTRLEQQDIATLEALGFEVCNPNEEPHGSDCLKRKDVMSYFEELVAACDALAVRAFPADNMIGAGCVREIELAQTMGYPVIELPSLDKSRLLSVAQTRKHQPHIYGK